MACCIYMMRIYCDMHSILNEIIVKIVFPSTRPTISEHPSTLEDGENTRCH